MKKLPNCADKLSCIVSIVNGSFYFIFHAVCLSSVVQNIRLVRLFKMKKHSIG